MKENRCKKRDLKRALVLFYSAFSWSKKHKLASAVLLINFISMFMASLFNTLFVWGYYDITPLSNSKRVR